MQKSAFDTLSVFGTKHYVLSHFQIPCGGCNRKFLPRCVPKKTICLVCQAKGDWSHVQDKIQGNVDRSSTVPSSVQGKVDHPCTVPSGVQGKVDHPSTVPSGVQGKVDSPSTVSSGVHGKVDRPSTVPSDVQGKVDRPSTVPSGVQGKIDDPSTVPRGAYKCVRLNKGPKQCQGCLQTFVHGFERHVLVRYEQTTYQPPSGPQRVTWRNCYYHVVMACVRKTNAAGTLVVVIAEDVEAGTAKFLQESGFFHIWWCKCLLQKPFQS